MSAAANYTEERTLDFWLKANSQTTTAPATVYVALFNSDPSLGSTAENLEAGTITDECTGGAYSRQSVTFGTIRIQSPTNKYEDDYYLIIEVGFGSDAKDFVGVEETRLKLGPITTVKAKTKEKDGKTEKVSPNEKEQKLKTNNYTITQI